MTKERGRKSIETNRRARHLYVVLDTVEVGIALVGSWTNHAVRRKWKLLQHRSETLKWTCE